MIGEALIDVVRLEAPGDQRARPGRSPCNAAVGPARLGHRKALMTWLGHRAALMARPSDNTFGLMPRPTPPPTGAEPTVSAHAAEPTTSAAVSMDARGRARYGFSPDGHRRLAVDAGRNRPEPSRALRPARRRRACWAVVTRLEVTTAPRPESGNAHPLRHENPCIS
ncbi:hypothetical protein N8I84_18065 [Streptomyces cynarae]|uniref:Uncharacterized protein n=1 Tax=Streptomyces cynarae TaxID=2981134 RepID=A0ABY6E166_9ACTN|nr:hypothetical protein [Streptomyces cynarae]UXY20410.1 hypothetical protein N8I84_18065 [Streptomyces cynarae]